MAYFKYEVRRRTIYFSDHALDRYWQRYMDDNPHAGRKDCRQTLADEMASARWHRGIPPWSHMNLWHRARCEGVVYLDDDRAFVINRNPSKDLVAVTYIENPEGMRFRKREVAHVT